MIYTTQEMPDHKAKLFSRSFDKLIGTEHEIQPATEFTSTVTCLGLTTTEVSSCRKLEEEVINEPEGVKHTFSAKVPTYLYALGLMAYIKRDIGPDKHVSLKKHNNQWTVTATNMTAQEVTKANALLKENLA